MNLYSKNMSEIQNDGGHPPIKTQHGFSAFILKMAHAAPMPGGKMKDGDTRLLSAHSSAYLFQVDEAGKEFGLIDSGIDPKAKEILAVLKYQGLDAGAVKAIFLTHGHNDHTSGVHAFPEADVYISAGDRGVIEGTAVAEGFLPRLSGRQPEPSVVNPDKLHTIGDGETITVGNKSVRCFIVPGHTKGSAVYLIGDILHLGDAAYFDNKGRAQKAPSLVSANLDESLRSLAALVKRFDDEGIQVNTVTSGHSGEGTFDALRELAATAK